MCWKDGGAELVFSGEMLCCDGEKGEFVLCEMSIEVHPSVLPDSNKQLTNCHCLNCQVPKYGIVLKLVSQEYNLFLSAGIQRS